MPRRQLSMVAKARVLIMNTWASRNHLSSAVHLPTSSTVRLAVTCRSGRQRTNIDIVCLNQPPPVVARSKSWVRHCQARFQKRNPSPAKLTSHILNLVGLCVHAWNHAAHKHAVSTCHNSVVQHLDGASHCC